MARALEARPRFAMQNSAMPGASATAAARVWRGCNCLKALSGFADKCGQGEVGLYAEDEACGAAFDGGGEAKDAEVCADVPDGVGRFDVCEDNVEELGVAPVGAEFEVGERGVGGDEDSFGGEWGRKSAPEGTAAGESLEDSAGVPHLCCVSFSNRGVGQTPRHRGGKPSRGPIICVEISPRSGLQCLVSDGALVHTSTGD